MLLVLVAWLVDCPPATRLFLAQPSALSVLTALVSVLVLRTAQLTA